MGIAVLLVSLTFLGGDVGEFTRRLGLALAYTGQRCGFLLGCDASKSDRLLRRKDRLLLGTGSLGQSSRLCRTCLRSCASSRGARSRGTCVESTTRYGTVVSSRLPQRIARVLCATF
eukprot:scaffold3675_cov212-Pinguiococcus_pyrenoidosus.AAC.1